MVAGRYPIYLTMQILILAVFALGFNLLFGYTGLLSFGQAGFFAVGAYACAKILLVVPNLLLGIAGGVAVAGVAALLLGILSVRHTRIYFSMLTLAFGMMIYSIAWKWRDFTGGDDGLVGIPRAPLEIPGLFSVSVASIERYYYVVLVPSLLAILAMHRLVHSPLGLTLQAIRDSESRAAFAGVPCASIGLSHSPLPDSTPGWRGRSCRRSRTQLRRRSHTGARRPNRCSQPFWAAYMRSRPYRRRRAVFRDQGRDRAFHRILAHLVRCDRGRAGDGLPRRRDEHLRKRRRRARGRYAPQ